MKERRVSDEENVAEQKVSEKFQIGDLVWAKMKSYPPWPGKIVERPDNLKLNTKSKVHYILHIASLLISLCPSKTFRKLIAISISSYPTTPCTAFNSLGRIVTVLSLRMTSRPTQMNKTCPENRSCLPRANRPLLPLPSAKLGKPSQVKCIAKN